jgi:ribosomal protein L15
LNVREEWGDDKERINTLGSDGNGRGRGNAGVEKRSRVEVWLTYTANYLTYSFLPCKPHLIVFY